MKYTKLLLETVAKECVSIAGVMRELGLAEAGGTHGHLSRKLKEFQVDTSHFLGMAANRGAAHKGPEKKPWQQVLVLRTHGRFTNAKQDRARRQRKAPWRNRQTHAA